MHGVHGVHVRALFFGTQPAGALSNTFSVIFEHFETFLRRQCHEHTECARAHQLQCAQIDVKLQMGTNKSAQHFVQSCVLCTECTEYKKCAQSAQCA